MKMKRRSSKKERPLRILLQLSPATIARYINRHPKRAIYVARINQIQRRLANRDYDLNA